MLFSLKKKSRITTPFSRFIREAPAKEKKRVYGFVLKKASEEQNEVLKKASEEQNEVLKKTAAR